MYMPLTGHYWGSISTGCTCESVEASDLVLAVGCSWTDYSTLGYSLLLQPGKVVAAGPDRVTIKGGETYGCIDMEVRHGGGGCFVLKFPDSVEYGGEGKEGVARYF
jgi:TPP-dependent 2-oxoacid decarboxylase